MSHLIYKILRKGCSRLVWVILLSFALSSCSKDWLEQKPDKNLTIPTTLQDFEELLRAVVLTFSPLNIGDIASDGHSVSPAAQSRITSFGWIINTYTWTNNQSSTEVPYWDRCYAAVLNANVALEGLRKYQPLNSAEAQKANRLKAQASFQRARLFFELAQIWAPPYDEETSSSDLCIPIRIQADKSSPSIRLSVKETYEIVIKDIEGAITHLPTFPENVMIPSKAAAYGQLARIYLSMRKYDMAGRYADSALQYSNALIDFNTLNTTLSVLGWNNAEVILQTRQPYGYVVPSTDIIDSSLYALFDTNDLRKIIFFRKSSNGSISFKGNYNNTSDQLFTGLTTAEMFLIKAESNARDGMVERAMEDINVLLKSRYSNLQPYTPLTAANQSQALDIILKERKKELILRGQRWTDLRRLNVEPGLETTLTREWDNTTFVLQPESYKYTLPIPSDVIQLGGFTQNAGW